MMDVTEPKQAEFGPERASAPVVKRDGPFWLAVALAAGGAVYLLLGSLTIVPWIPDERGREAVSGVWVAMSRHLPDIGQPTLAKLGFWLLVSLVAMLCVWLLIAASRVRDDDEQDPGTPA